MEFNDNEPLEDFKSFRARVTTDENGVMELDCNPDNTVLYLHRPDVNEDYDHIFYQLNEEQLPEEHRGQNRNMGAFITRHVLGDDTFEAIAARMWNSDNWTVVYRPDPTPADRKNIDEQIAAMFHREIDEFDISDFMDE